MAIHVAILKRPYADAVLAGRKTVESRLTRTAMPPFGVIEAGERVYFKSSGGPFMAMARAGTIDAYHPLTPGRMRELQDRYRGRVGGNDEYWLSKQGSLYAVFIHLVDVEPIDVGPAYRKANMKAWHVLDEAQDPVRDTVLTAGAVRNGYVRLTDAWPIDAESGGIELMLPDGASIRTDITKGRRLRWRGWTRYFRERSMAEGDVVRFVAAGAARYRVTFRRRDPEPA